jgi:hypothetical protein
MHGETHQTPQELFLSEQPTLHLLACLTDFRAALGWLHAVDGGSRLRRWNRWQLSRQTD